MTARKVTAGRLWEVLSSGRASLKGRDERVLLRVHVDTTCARELVLAVKGALVAERAGGVVEVRGISLDDGGERPDAVIVLAGSGEVADLVSRYAGAGVPVALVVEGALDAPRLSLTEQAAALVTLVAASSAGALVDKLASWLAGESDKAIALAANFPFCRGAVVDALVRRCAAQNAAVGAVHLIPGSDLPVMTVNQAKLALDVAAAYGEGVDASRAAELAGVVGAGLAYRALARTLLGLVPGIGGLVRAGVGYAGTLATGEALRARFELPAHVSRREEKGAPAPEARRPGLAPAPAEPGDGYVTIGEAIS